MPTIEYYFLPASPRSWLGHERFARIAAAHGAAVNVKPVDAEPSSLLIIAADARAQFDAYTAEAIVRGVFGAPTYVHRDELFWGQDRLEFLDRALQRAQGA